MKTTSLLEIHLSGIFMLWVIEWFICTTSVAVADDYKQFFRLFYFVDS